MNADFLTGVRYYFMSLVYVGAVLAHTVCASPAISNVANLQVSQESLKRIVELAEQCANTNRMSCKSIEITPYMERPVSTPGAIVTCIGKRATSGFYPTIVQMFRNTAWMSMHEMGVRGESTLEYPLTLGIASTNWYPHGEPITYPSYELQNNNLVSFVALHGEWSHVQVSQMILLLRRWLAENNQSNRYDLSHLTYIGPMSSTRIVFGFSKGFREIVIVFDVTDSNLRFIMSSIE